MHIVVPNPTVHRSERGEQSGPGVVAAFEQFFAVLVGQFPQLLADRGDGVVLFVNGEGFAGNEFPFLGTEKEHQPHHHRERRLVELFGRHVGQEFPAKVLIGSVERMDQHFNRPPHLIAELVGDFLLIGSTPGEQGFERLIVGDVEEPAGREQAAKSSQGDRLFEPEGGIPRGIAGRFALGGIDQHPMLAVGDEAEPDASAVQQLGHAGIGRGFPRGASDVAGEFLRAGIGLDQQPCLLRARIVDDDAGPQQFVMFGDVDVQRLRDRLPFGQHLLIEVECPGEDKPDPVVMRSGVRLPLFERSLPGGVLLPQQPGNLRVVRFEARIECFHQHRQAEERTRDRHERKPFSVVTCDGHGLNDSLQNKGVDYQGSAFAFIREKNQTRPLTPIQERFCVLQCLQATNVYDTCPSGRRSP